MSPWHYFVTLLNETLGTENVRGGLGAHDKTAVAAFEQTVTLKDGTTKKRRQKLHFEYDGKDTSRIAVTSFIGPVDDADLSGFLAFLGEDWTRPAAVVVDGELALRHHLRLPETDGDKATRAADEKVLAQAFIASLALGSFADTMEDYYFEDDE
ncbi:hypothetical protein [Embleya sp. NPDC005971]|uniref:hypothetical protein n=1 Tax=Embleya sp. NPDC005971 TaxID=3156724 RepID=UPI0033ECAEA0